MPSFNVNNLLLGGLKPSLQIMYRPGANTGGNIFGSWSELMEVHAAAAPGPKTIIVDDSIESPAVIPAGIYDMTDTSIEGSAFTAGGTALELHVDGVQLPGLRRLACGLTITYGGSTTVVDFGGRILDLEDRVVVVTTGSAVFNVSGGSTGILRARDQTALGAGTVNVEDGEDIEVIARSDSNFGAGIFAGGATSTGTIDRDSSCSFIQPTGIWTGAAWTDTLADKSAAEAYVDGTAGSWAVSAPVDVNSALDRLAVAVQGLLGGQIP